MPLNLRAKPILYTRTEDKFSKFTIMDIGPSSVGPLAAILASLPADRHHDIGKIRSTKSRGWRRHLRHFKASSRRQIT